jgi:hypothetical protein
MSEMHESMVEILGAVRWNMFTFVYEIASQSTAAVHQQ